MLGGKQRVEVVGFVFVVEDVLKCFFLVGPFFQHFFDENTIVRYDIKKTFRLRDDEHLSFFFGCLLGPWY